MFAHGFDAERDEGDRDGVVAASPVPFRWDFSPYASGAELSQLPIRVDEVMAGLDPFDSYPASLQRLDRQGVAERKGVASGDDGFVLACELRIGEPLARAQSEAEHAFFCARASARRDG